MTTRAEFEALLSRLPVLIRERRVWPNPPKPGGPSGHDPIALAIRGWLQEFGFGNSVALSAEGMRAQYGIKTYNKNPEAVSLLTPEQYRVTQEDGTERPFQND